jgi:hypothetical protein
MRPILASALDKLRFRQCLEGEDAWSIRARNHQWGTQ